MKTPMTTNLALLVMRLSLGAIMIAHGLQICFGLWGGEGMESFQAYLLTNLKVPADPYLGVPLNELLGWAVGVGELGGGALVALGVFARFGAFWIAVIMGGAIAMVHGSEGFFLKDGGLEYNLALLGLSLGILFMGAGGFSLYTRKKK